MSAAADLEATVRSSFTSPGHAGQAASLDGAGSNVKISTLLVGTMASPQHSMQTAGRFQTLGFNSCQVTFFNPGAHKAMGLSPILWSSCVATDHHNAPRPRAGPQHLHSSPGQRYCADRHTQRSIMRIQILLHGVGVPSDDPTQILA